METFPTIPFVPQFDPIGSFSFLTLANDLWYDSETSFEAISSVQQLTPRMLVVVEIDEVQVALVDSSNWEEELKRLTLVHPNNHESKVRKLLPEASKNRKSQFPETREVGAKTKGLDG
ncbi:hypothetical protein GQ457_04G023140 [Hibiscus cannabinus]